jgi:RNA polymerase sigma-70 factor (ECF subfamily)
MTLVHLDTWLSAPRDDGDAMVRGMAALRGHAVRADAPVDAGSWSDADRVARLRAGDTTVFEQLFFEYATPLRRFVNALVHSIAGAEDIVQDVFVHVWERRTSIEVKTSIRAYLYAAARGRALMALRAAGVRESYAARPVTDDVLVVPRAVPDALAGLERDELTRALSQALASLPQRTRQAAELRWFGKLSHAEVAVVMGTSPATVNNQITAALRSLREQLRPHLE